MPRKCRPSSKPRKPATKSSSPFSLQPQGSSPAPSVGGGSSTIASAISAAWTSVPNLQAPSTVSTAAAYPAPVASATAPAELTFHIPADAVSGMILKDLVCDPLESFDCLDDFEGMAFGDIEIGVLPGVDGR